MHASIETGHPAHGETRPVKLLFGRFLLPDQSEHACSVSGISVEGAEFRCPVMPPFGQIIIAYLEHVGRVECMAKEATTEGFRVEFMLSGARKDRFLARLAWLASKEAGEVDDERHYNRRQLNGARSRIVLADGRSYPCEIIDVSLTGAAIMVDVLPAIGSNVYLGKMLGKVVRYLDTGFAIQFLTAFGSDFLSEVMDESPHLTGGGQHPRSMP